MKIIQAFRQLLRYTRHHRGPHIQYFIQGKHDEGTALIAALEKYLQV